MLLNDEALHETPAYVCRRIQTSHLHEIDWESCDAVWLSNNMTGLSPKEQTEVRACWSEEGLFIRYLCEDTWIRSDYRKRDDPLYEQDVIEVFIDETGEGRSYIELEVSPYNIIFDAVISNDGIDTITGSDLQWDIPCLQTSVDRTEEGLLQYLLVIPFTTFQSAPAQGTKWRMNFYRIDEDRLGAREYQAWSPTLANNFHIPAKFGTLVFHI
ncbi:carbohydrate-binding family 9-like protein [Paenibacillus sp. PL2-23]|uniref:carbohydrate-binding family 9-like protein n=1 Tax=Paenibacillus sp. PL2-23 TaxID=2100729 RepID=UPI0030F4F325